MCFALSVSALWQVGLKHGRSICAGVAIRSGHHCTQPLHAYLGLSASARASPYIYNTEEEIDVFIRELEESISFFRDA